MINSFSYYVAVNHAYGDGYRLSERALALGRELSGSDPWDGSMRHDPVLVEVVRQLGVYASTGDALIEVEQIENPHYRIVCRSGYEEIVTPNRASGWVNALERPTAAGTGSSVAASRTRRPA
ncbi:MAG: hypothetical protein JOY64_04215 [Alphaproteobacteria bacterium]|nr:hypothetical protein [Alphaproteobacteria bacterium]MBV8406811.1 hypothetical protein [Alphaproteobacteria bacterium]